MKTILFAFLIGLLFLFVGCEHPERHAGGHPVDFNPQANSPPKYFELVQKREHDDGVVYWNVRKKPDPDLPRNILAIVKLGDANFSIVLPLTASAKWAVFNGLGNPNSSQVCAYDPSKFQIFDGVQDPKISTNWVLWLTNTLSQSTSSGITPVGVQFLVPALQASLVSGPRASAIYDGYYDVASITLPWEEVLDNAKKDSSK